MQYYHKTKPALCPVCGSTQIIEILYGLPDFTPELEAEIEAGDVILGGCIFSSQNPTWKCKQCKTPIFKIRTPKSN